MISWLFYCLKRRFVCAKCEIEISIKCAYNKRNSYQQSMVIFYYQILVIRPKNSCKKGKEMVDSGFRDSSYYDTINIESTLHLYVYGERRFCIE